MWRGTGGSSVEPATAAWLFVRGYFRTRVCGSVAVASLIGTTPLGMAAGHSGSLNSLMENARSSAVKAVPSCHLRLGLSFQVTSMLPSAFTFQSPSATEGTFVA